MTDTPPPVERKVTAATLAAYLAGLAGLAGYVARHTPR